MSANEIYPIRYWENPHQDEVADSLTDFLHQLDGPTWIYIQGADSTRCRVITTLLHGNEPSGLYALHSWLQSDYRAAVDLYCFIGAVEAARANPTFTHRMLPEKRDLNRCFRPPFNDDQGQIAADLLHRIYAVQPEAVIDIHNTSGAGPSFAVACDTRNQHRLISQLFTSRLIITDIRLGALMEVDDAFPVTTIECGGAHDPQAHQVAWDGFKRVAFAEQLFPPDAAPGDIDIYHHPVRVELLAGCELSFASEAVPGADLTLHTDIEGHNFGVVQAGTELGWLGQRGLSSIVVRDSLGRDHSLHYFDMLEDRLVTRHTLKLFMITKRIDIAKSDCLFYLVPVE